LGARLRLKLGHFASLVRRCRSLHEAFAPAENRGARSPNGADQRPMCSKALQTATAARNEPGDLNEAGLMPEMGEKGNGWGCARGVRRRIRLAKGARRMAEVRPPSAIAVAAAPQEWSIESRRLPARRHSGASPADAAEP